MAMPKIFVFYFFRCDIKLLYVEQFNRFKQTKITHRVYDRFFKNGQTFSISDHVSAIFGADLTSAAEWPFSGDGPEDGMLLSCNFAFATVSAGGVVVVVVVETVPESSSESDGAKLACFFTLSQSSIAEFFEESITIRKQPMELWINWFNEKQDLKFISVIND